MDGKPRVYNTAEAAKYVGLTLDVFKYHLYESKHLTPDFQLGRELGFYQSTLDAYLRKYQSNDLTIQEAAAYLGVSLHRMRDHVHNLKTVQPSGKRGKFNTYSKADLDAARPIITAKTKLGRPPKAGPSVK